MIHLISHTSFDGVNNIKPLHVKFLTCKEPKYDSIDALVFTSKNGVLALDRFGESWRDIPSFVIGEATARTIMNLGGNVEFVSNVGYGDHFAKEVSPYLKNKTVLFSRAKQVVSDVSGILTQNSVKVDELITYETICEDCENLAKPMKNSTLIFASPSSVYCFLKCFSWDESWRVVCIGHKTAAELPKNVSWVSPKTRSIEECVKLAKELEAS